GIKSPLYRFPMTVFNTVYPQLINKALTETDILAITTFYSQVDQMNRGLDAVDRLRHDPQGQMTREVERLLMKASEMQHPEEGTRPPGGKYDFYAGAMATIDRHLRRR